MLLPVDSLRMHFPIVTRAQTINICTGWICEHVLIVCKCVEALTLPEMRRLNIQCVMSMYDVPNADF